LLQFLHLANISMKSDPLHSAWVRCAFGVFVWLIAQLLEFYCEMVLNLIAYGTIADAFWVIGYFPLILGFHSVVKHAMAGAETFTGKWMLLFFSAAYVILFVFLILPQWQHPQTWGEAVLDFAYPTFDFILLTQAFLVMKSTGSGKPLFRFALLAQASFLLTLIGDAILSLIQNFNSFIYKSIDIYYFSCYFVLALAAEQQAQKHRNLKHGNHGGLSTETRKARNV
ncbi:MAG TPA: hypothetical protein VJ521_04050, partial [Acidobacteriota bacterium]|nr:hypothetical protein [Acidobacteriota bacterium]